MVLTSLGDEGRHILRRCYGTRRRVRRPDQRDRFAVGGRGVRHSPTHEEMRDTRFPWLARHPGLVLLTYSVVVLVAILAFLRNRTDDLAGGAATETATIVGRTITEFRTVYTSEVVERVRPLGVDVSHDYVGRPGAIPLPATLSLELARRVGEGDEDGPQVRLYSAYPFPWRKAAGGLTDEFARRAWELLRSDPTTPYVSYEGTGDQRVLRFATADLMRESCVGVTTRTPSLPSGTG